MLKMGEFLKAEKKELYLYMQEDANLCLYPNKEKNFPLWTSGTYLKGSPPHVLVMQDDGNLVIYDSNKKPTWSTNTHGKGKGCILSV